MAPKARNADGTVMSEAERNKRKSAAYYERSKKAKADKAAQRVAEEAAPLVNAEAVNVPAVNAPEAAPIHPAPDAEAEPPAHRVRVSQHGDAQQTRSFAHGRMAEIRRQSLACLRSLQKSRIEPPVEEKPRAPGPAPLAEPDNCYVLCQDCVIDEDWCCTAHGYNCAEEKALEARECKWEREHNKKEQTYRWNCLTHCKQYSSRRLRCEFPRCALRLRHQCVTHGPECAQFMNAERYAELRLFHPQMPAVQPGLVPRKEFVRQVLDGVYKAVDQRSTVAYQAVSVVFSSKMIVETCVSKFQKMFCKQTICTTLIRFGAFKILFLMQKPIVFIPPFRIDRGNGGTLLYTSPQIGQMYDRELQRFIFQDPANLRIVHHNLHYRLGNSKEHVRAMQLLRTQIENDMQSLGFMTLDVVVGNMYEYGLLVRAGISRAEIRSRVLPLFKNFAMALVNANGWPMDVFDAFMMNLLNGRTLQSCIQQMYSKGYVVDVRGDVLAVLDPSQILYDECAELFYETFRDANLRIGIVDTV